MPELHVEPIAPYDLDFIEAMIPYFKDFEPEWEPDDEWRAVYLPAIFNDPNRRLWWAALGGERVGFVNFIITADWPNPAHKVGHIAEFTIFPAYRRRGYGRLLAQAVFEELWTRGVNRIELSVLAGREHSYAFWESLGCRPGFTVMRAPSPH